MTHFEFLKSFQDSDKVFADAEGENLMIE